MLLMHLDLVFLVLPEDEGKDVAGFLVQLHRLPGLVLQAVCYGFDEFRMILRGPTDFAGADYFLQLSDES